MTKNLTIFASLSFMNEFKPLAIRGSYSDLKKVIYYINPFEYHHPPNPEDPLWASVGLECEIRKPPVYSTDTLEKELESVSYDTPTLIIIKKRILE